MNILVGMLPILALFIAMAASGSDSIFEAPCYFYERPDGAPIRQNNNCEITSSHAQGYYLRTIRFSSMRSYVVSGDDTETVVTLDNSPAAVSHDAREICWQRTDPFLKVCYGSISDPPSDLRPKLSSNNSARQLLEELVISGKETDALEKVALFTEQYIGKTLVFSGCTVPKTLDRTDYDGYYSLEVTSRKGQLFFVFDSILPGKLGFLVSKTIADQMTPDLNKEYQWTNVTLEAEILRRGDKRRPYFVAMVKRINLSDRNGKPFRGFIDKAINTRKTFPELEREANGSSR